MSLRLLLYLKTVIPHQARKWSEMKPLQTQTTATARKALKLGQSKLVTIFSFLEFFLGFFWVFFF